jgi:hypothetical protein
VLAEQPGERRDGQTTTLDRRRSTLEERPEPGLVGARSEFEKLRPDSLEAFAQLVGGAQEVAVQACLLARELAHGNETWVLGLDLSEAMWVGPEGIGEDESVTPVILGASHGVAIPEAVGLFWVGGKDGGSGVEECFEERTAGASMAAARTTRSGPTCLRSQVSPSAMPLAEWRILRSSSFLPARFKRQAACSWLPQSMPRRKVASP